MNNEIVPISFEKLRPSDMVAYDVTEVEEKEVIEVRKEEVEVAIKKVRPKNPEINIRSLPVLDALSKATAQRLSPLRLRSNDRLELFLDNVGERFIARTYSVDSEGKEFGPASLVARNFFERIPEHHALGSRMVLGGTDFSALVIYNSWPETQIVFIEEAAKILYEYLIARFMVQTRFAVAQAKFKLNREIPALPEDFVEHPDPNLKLADYQLAALSLCVDNEACCLWFKQGLGKTPVAIHKMIIEAKRTRRGLYGKPRMMRTLIVCPQHLRKNWEKEIGRFTTVAGKIVVLRGGKIRRINGLIDAVREEDDCVFSAAICSYETIENTWEALEKIAWDLVILDETQYIKDPRSVRSKACVKNLRNMSRRRLELTGTPYGNHQMDLYPQFEFLGEGMSGFMTYKNFKYFHTRTAKNPAQWEKTLQASNVPLLKERIARVAFTLSKEEAGLKLPNKVRDIYEVTPTSMQAKIYAQLQNELRAQIKSDLSGEIKQVTVEHILTKLLRLAQVTSGHVKYDEVWADDGQLLQAGSLEQIPGGNPKVDAIIDMYRENQESDPKGKMVIWIVFDEDARVISERLAKEGICHVGYKPEIVKEFRKSGADEAEIEFNTNENCKVFIGNPKSGGSGLNLVGWDYANPETSPDTYCNHVIYFSKNWSMLERAQSEDRSAERRSTKCNVRITDLEIEGTIDEELREVVFGKMKASRDIQDLTALLAKVLDTDKLLDGD